MGELWDSSDECDVCGMFAHPQIAHAHGHETLCGIDVAGYCDCYLWLHPECCPCDVYAFATDARHG